MAEQPVRPARGDDAEQRADQDGEHQRRDDQQQGRRDAPEDELGDRKVEIVGRAEVALDHLADIRRQLDVERAVEPVGAPDIVHYLLAGAAAFPGKRVGDVARHQRKEDEIEDDDRQQQHSSVEESLGNDGQECDDTAILVLRSRRRGGFRLRRPGARPGYLI